MKLKKIQNLAFYWELGCCDYYIANGHCEENVIFRIPKDKKYLIFDVEGEQDFGHYIGEETKVSSKMLAEIFEDIERRKKRS